MFDESDTSFIRWANETTFLPAREKERVLLILTVSYIELLINCLAKEHEISGAKTLHSKVNKLKEQNLINPELCDFIHWIRKLRNRAAHEPFFRLKNEDVEHLPSYWSNPKYFEHVCKGICGSLWNEHSTTFGKVFGTFPSQKNADKQAPLT